MHKTLRYFILFTLISTVIVMVVLAFLYRNALHHQLVQAALRESVALTRVLGNTLQQDENALSDFSHLTDQDLALLDRRVRELARSFEVLQVDIYALNGVVIYSTDAGRLGMNKAQTAGIRQARNGSHYSEFITEDRFYTLYGTKLQHEAISCYIPADWSGDGKTDLVVQVYVNTVGQPVAAGTGRDTNFTAVMLTSLGYVGVLLIVLVLAQKKARLQETEMLNQQQEIHFHIYRDSLTGLPNRALLRDRLELAMRRAQQRERLLAVLTLDLDRFKHINNRFGFAAGDDLLLKVAERLKKYVQKTDTLARTCGGTFVIVLEDIMNVDEASEAVNHILDVMSEAFLIQTQEVFVTFSIGIALYPFDDEHVDSLLEKSSVAMYQAKDAGINSYRFYNSRKREQAVTRFSLENSLHRALERNEFKLFYQPFVQLNTGNIIGVEALLRWQTPAQGIIPPLEFISVLEESGLIIEVGKWVLETACTQGARWREQGFGDLKINVNISARQFKQSSLLQQVTDALRLSTLPPHLLNLEITESVLLEKMDGVINMLDQLHHKGVSMSVDDFGTGYSSMSYLKNMPIETIKIDRNFVRGLPFDLDDVAIIHAIDQLSRQMRLNVIAEGVETETQLDFLRKQNIFAVQGYLISRPLPATELETLFAGYNPARFKA